MIRTVRAPVRIDFAGGTTDIEPFASKYGGAVLNAAINHYIEGKIIADSKKVHLEYSGNIPTSSGLGTSGVMNLVWLSLISKTRDKIELAEKVYKLEQSQGLVGGKQDQYAAAFGGINLMKFKQGSVQVNPLNLSKRIVGELENSLILVYTGEHYSGFSNKLMINNLKNNTGSLLRIRDIALEMAGSLKRGNLALFSELLNEEKKERKKLHKLIIPPRTEKFISDGMKNGASGAKVCGSGGGGSIVFFGDKARLKRYFGSKAISFKFDFSGLTWLD